MLSDSLRNASLTFERFPELTDANTSIETTFLTHLEDFYKFCQKTKIGINRYIYNQEKLFLILNADNVELSVIENHSQLTLEQSVYNIISEITSNDFIESLEVVEGSRGFNVNDIVEYETNASVRPIKTIVTSTIDGHVRHTTIPRLDGVEDGNDRTGFTPGDTLVDNDDDTSALSLTVNTVKNGFVTGVKIYDRHSSNGSGFNTIDSNEVFTNGSASIHSQPDAAKDGQNLELKITDIKGELASIDIGTASENIKLNDELSISPRTFVYTEQEQHQDATVTVTSIDVKNIIQHSIGIEESYPTYTEFLLM